MIRTTLTTRLALLGASTALAAGGALLPSSAFAAPAAPQVAAVQTAPAHEGHHSGNTSTVTVTKIVNRTLPDGRVKVTSTTTVTKTTKRHGKVVRQTVTTTVSTKTLPAPQDD
ncbi:MULTISPECIES: hypothetical protein [unclassified Streptomyces]|uniref:hypothetical protein n=1 Tax=unclassified Streptomyces TaxID=2593676 RepID=UPI000A58772C|nr:hypothetical protein OG299_36640 [Streptomyces sp. NBC_01296]WSW57667.1 hypothetical protein OG513_03275 [Streptomyces sp. NBC_00998]